MPSDVRVVRTKWKREQPRAEFIGRTAFSNDQIAESHRVTMVNTTASTRHMKSSATARQQIKAPAEAEELEAAKS